MVMAFDAESPRGSCFLDTLVLSDADPDNLVSWQASTHPAVQTAAAAAAATTSALITR
jgi:hypothetical protein